jgi:hypothetical protein
MRVNIGRARAANRVTVAVRSTGEAGSAAVSHKGDMRVGFVSRSEWHRLRWRCGRQADESKGRRNQDFSHGFAFQSCDAASTSEASLNAR